MFAQDNEQVTTNVSKAKNNWFISLGGGPSILQAEQDQDKPYGERIRFAAELSVGKWFTPYFGARLQLTGGPLRGYNYQENHGGELKERYLREDRSRGEYPLGVTFGKDGQPNWSGIETVGNGFWQDFNYGAATIDLMANLTNLFQGYYKENKVDIIPYLGGGWIHATESNTNPVHDGIVGKLGARVNFNLNPKWAIYLDPQAYFSSD
ncbi:MAG: hypothetical protein LBN74_09625, partial [Prevotella sp.]|nr:hypothetical protein [Prevotella sp.]